MLDFVRRKVSALHRYLVEYHPVVGYRFIPGLKARHPHESGGYLIRINNAGFRSNYDFVPQKRPGIRRILLFGDSFTFGDGVAVEKRYGDLLEKAIPNLEVYNFGLTGSGTDQQYLAYREFAADIEFDVIILAVWVENIRRVAAHYSYSYDEVGVVKCIAKPYYELNDGKLVLRNGPPARELIPEADLPEAERQFVYKGGRLARVKRLLARFGVTRLAQRIMKPQAFPEYDSPLNPSWQTMRAILEEWIGLNPKKTLLMPLPTHHYIEEVSSPTQYQARFHEVADAANCLILDPLPHFLRYSSSERRRFRFPKDVHLTPQGHAALAAGMSPVVARLLESTG